MKKYSILLVILIACAITAQAQVSSSLTLSTPEPYYYYYFSPYSCDSIVNSQDTMRIRLRFPNPTLVQLSLTPCDTYVIDFDSYRTPTRYFISRAEFERVRLLGE